MQREIRTLISCKEATRLGLDSSHPRSSTCRLCPVRQMALEYGLDRAIEASNTNRMWRLSNKLPKRRVKFTDQLLRT